MAKTLIIYPYADVNIEHTKSNTSSSGYSLINDTTNNTTGSLNHTIDTTLSTKTSSFSNLSHASNVTLGKIRINSISSVNFYIGHTVNSNTRIDSFSLSSIVIIDNINYNSTEYTNILVSDQANRTNYDNPVLSITGSNSVNKIFNSLSDANILMSFTTTAKGTQTNTGIAKSFSASAQIYNANVTISYDDVFDCKAEIMTGVGIVSATPTAQEIVDGDTCTFSATIENEWRFIGWYENSDFSGTPVSTNISYTTTITKNTILYPKAEPKYNINIYGDTTRFNYTCSSGSQEYGGESVTINITPTKSIYKFAGIYEADIDGNKLSTHISNDNPYMFTMPHKNINLYIEIGKEIKIYVDCKNCSISSGSSPIISSNGKTETLTFTYDTLTSDWSGLYQDSGYTIRLTNELTYTFVVPDNDVYLYAKAIPKQQIYIKENGVWETYSEVYVKENGTWVLKDDYENIFNILKNYKRNML